MQEDSKPAAKIAEKILALPVGDQLKIELTKERLLEVLRVHGNARHALLAFMTLSSELAQNGGIIPEPRIVIATHLNG